MAVALVAGQAMLYAVIGWLTFMQSPAGPVPERADPPVAPRIALPTASMVLPPVSLSTTRAPSAPERTVTRTGRPVTPAGAVTKRPPAPSPEPARPKPSRPKPAPEVPAEPAPVEVIAPVAPPTAPDLGTAPDPAQTDEVQGPVVPGEPCDPAGALGVTSDGVALRCEEQDERLVWQII
ncbi:MAG TPA: hypothetical protein VFR35_18745 [Actinoplanes sp.]|nr:hypothetical protein [Actinoplanes sp.]